MQDCKSHFITYGNKRFRLSKMRLSRQAKNSDFFDSIKIYGPEDISKTFKKKFGHILKQWRGGGYWIWKYFILSKRMEEIEEGDFLIYLDAGCSINIKGKKRYLEYLEMLNNSKYGIILFQHKLMRREREWTVKEIFNYFKVDINSDIAKSNQTQGGVLIMKKNKHSLSILDKYKEVLESNPKLITDYYNKQNQIPQFIENRHDQSLLSVIGKLYGSISLKNENRFKRKGKRIGGFRTKESLKYPFWATRIKDKKES